MTQLVRVALLGAESTGKSLLAQALAAALARQGLAVHVVPEWLRSWCEQAGRTPQAHEQPDIARTHAAQLDAAALALARSGQRAVLLADTTPLMVAIYSDLLFDDRSLYPMALAHQRGYDLTLLTGLDLPWVADGLQRDGPHVRGPVDAKVREALQQAGLPFQIIYGRDQQRLLNAERALRSEARLAAWLPAPPAPAGAARTWQCQCDSDAACEHRLFRRLLAQRG